MSVSRNGWAILACSGLLFGARIVAAESVKDLPKPTSYVSDFAGVIDTATKQQMEQLCGEVDHEAHAQIAVVTVHSLGDESVEDFAADLEQKWGVGPKSSDRGVLLLYAINDHRDRIEVGYGLEGVLNDAKVGDILRSERSLLQQGQDSAAISGALTQVANDIASDAHVTLSQPQYQPRTLPARSSGMSAGSILRLVFFLLILFLLFRRRGGGGGYGGGGGGFWPGLLLGNLLGGSRGGNWGSGGGFSGGGSGEGDGGGFGGFGGGSSGGGGASGDW